MEFVKKIISRAAKEPALIVAVVVAVGNLIGQDLSSWGPLIESLVILAAGLLVRSQVSPVAVLKPMTADEFVDEYGEGDLAA